LAFTVPGLFIKKSERLIVTASAGPRPEYSV
jgi:hypothetical protein